MPEQMPPKESSEIPEEKNRLDSLVQSLQDTLISGMLEDKNIAISRLEDEGTKYIQGKSARDKTLRIAISGPDREIIQNGTYHGEPLFFGVFKGDTQIGSNVLSTYGIDDFLDSFDY
ncbi:MAG: hypothetical protein V1880_04580 [Patescibacteria group bacterium]